MRLYKTEALKLKSKEELKELKDLVKGHTDLTIEEKEANINLIDEALGIKYTKAEVLADIEAGKADISDIGGMN